MVDSGMEAAMAVVVVVNCNEQWDVAEAAANCYD